MLHGAVVKPMKPKDLWLRSLPQQLCQLPQFQQSKAGSSQAQLVTAQSIHLWGQTSYLHAFSLLTIMLSSHCKQ